jgi:hypothetical protein
MKRLSFLATLAVFLLALLGMLLLGGSKYDWMVDVDPTVSVKAIETTGNRDLAASLLLATALCAAAILARLHESRRARVAALLLASLAVVLYVISRA